MSATPQFDAAVATDEDDEYAAYKNASDEAFWSQVKDVARELRYDLPGFTYTLEWEESMADNCGVISAIEVGVYLPEHDMYLMRRRERNEATTDSTAEGKAQALAIRDALLAAYDAAAKIARRTDFVGA